MREFLTKLGPNVPPNYIHFYQFFINCSPFSSSSSTVMHVQCSSMLSNFSLFRFLNPIYLTPPCSLPLWVSHWGLLVKQFLCRNYHRCHNHSFLLVYFFFVRFFVFFDNLEHGQWSVPSLCFSSGSPRKSYQSINQSIWIAKKILSVSIKVQWRGFAPVSVVALIVCASENELQNDKHCHNVTSCHSFLLLWVSFWLLSTDIF